MTGGPGPSIPTGYILTRHSQETRIPTCPPGTNKLWDGYSFLFMEGNEGGHSQSLGMEVNDHCFLAKCSNVQSVVKMHVKIEKVCDRSVLGFIFPPSFLLSPMITATLPEIRPH